MAKQQSGETKAPLVVALAFFVLTTLTLGVLTYMAYDQVSQQKEEVRKANQDKDKAVSDLGEEKAKVIMYKTLVGTNTAEEFDNLKNGGKEAAAKAEFQAFQTTLLSRLPAVNSKASKDLVGTGKQVLIKPQDVVSWAWGEKLENPPQTTLIDAVANGYSRQLLAASKLEAETQRLDQANQTYQAATQRASAAEAEFKKQSASLPAQIAEVQKKADELIQATRNTFAGDTKKYTDDMKTKAEALEMEGIKLRQALAQAEGLSRRVEKAEEKLADTQDAFQFDRPHGKITRRDNNVVDINIGSADNVKPGLTFSVFSAETPTAGFQSRLRPRTGPDGRPVTEGGQPIMDVVPKGTIEVVSVLGAHLAQARITSNPDPIRDAIMATDVLYNPAWRKGAAEHVALFGVFDVDADGTDDIKRVVNDLTRMGIVVDAYYDLETRKWVGQVTEQTTYAVEGYYPVNVGGDPLANAKSEITQALNGARDTAREKGIQVVKARAFFPRAGYRINLNIGADTINRAYNRYLQLQAPGETPPPGN